MSYTFFTFSGFPDTIFFSLSFTHDIISLTKSTVTSKILFVCLKFLISAELIPIKVVSDTNPLFFLSLIASLKSLTIFLSNKFLISFKFPEAKFVIIDSYAILAPFRKSALAFSSKLFSLIFINSFSFVGKSWAKEVPIFSSWPVFYLKFLLI